MDVLRNCLSVNDDLPLCVDDFIELIDLCISNCCFTFNNVYFKQRSGMAMGSPISPILANLFLEHLETTRLRNIVPREVLWLRYVDDILVIAPRRLDLARLLDQINRVEDSIKFTLELEQDNKLPYLDVFLIRDENNLKFKVFRKPTCKNDYVHFYSDTNCKTKLGIVIGFFLRALRICSEEFLEEEYNIIFRTFMDLKFPPYFILKARKKAILIHSRNDVKEENVRRIILPKCSVANNTAPLLSKAGINVVQCSSLTIDNIIKKGRKQRSTEDKVAGVYSVPCKDCERMYIGETFRGLNTRLREHKYDMRCYNENNAIVMHRFDTGHTADWDNAKMIKYERDVLVRRCFESSYISTCKNFNQNNGFFTIAKPLAYLLTGKGPG